MAVVGAGINGCAAAEHLVAEGYNVLLIDKGDFGGEASSHSGRVLHCGLQVLAPQKNIWEFIGRPGDFLMRLRVARQMAEDHAELCRTVPGRLKAMDIAVPIYRDAGYAGWQVDFGARLIRYFNGGRNQFGYRRWKYPSQSPHPFASALQNRDRLESVVAFTDQRIDWPDRMAIDAALDAEDMGATIRNFTSVESLSPGLNGLWQLRLADRIQSDQVTDVSAHIVLNLGGAGVDRVIDCVRTNHDVRRKITAVKGVYILARLPPEYQATGVAGMNRIGEPICCLPWGDLHYIGPTETLFEGDIENATPGEDDIRFLLDEIRYFLPAITVSRKDVIMAWAGVRPITNAVGYPKGKRLPFNVLHDLDAEGLPGIFALSWGIVVNHRSTARRIVAAVSSRIAPSRQMSAVSYQPRQFPPSSSPRLQPDHPATLDDVRYCIEHEHAQGIAGVLFRRTGLAWTTTLNRQSVEKTGQIVGQALGWRRKDTDQEISNFIQYLQSHHCFELV
ncbi:MAG: FAD-dependent oxidoreductase [Hyphomicrobiales bacterium]|nr:FAD-dependent oxidoreductase [Hyphomicrobiales bacterium]